LRIRADLRALGLFRAGACLAAALCFWPPEPASREGAESHAYGCSKRLAQGLDDPETYRQLAEHARLIQEADLSFPIIMCSNRHVMDGMHRVLKALNAGMETIDAVIFEQDPEPDYVNIYPHELLY
jgi:hypothetical protein